MKHVSTRLFAVLACVLLPDVLIAQETPMQEPAVRMLQKAVPAVVNITTETKVRGGDPLLEDLLTPAGGRRTAIGTGSGFFISADGNIVTNHHVIEAAGSNGVTVTTQDGKTYTARLIASEKECDLALLKIDAKEPFGFIPLNDLSPNLLGQSLFAIGNPHGLGTSVSRGILSARARTLRLGGKEFADLLQTDAAINPGNSGGPIVDISGKLVAVSRLGYVGMEYRQAQGLGFGVPGNVVRMKIEDFMKKSPVTPTAKPGPVRIPGL